MRTKSILVLSAFSAVTFLANVAAAAPVNVTQSNINTQAVQTAQPKTVKTVQQAAQPRTVKTAQQVAQQEARQLEEPQVKHHAHRQGYKHKRKYRQHRHDDSSYGYEYADYYPVPREIPTSNFLLGASLGYVLQRENFESFYTTNVAGAVPGAYRGYSADEKNSGVLFGLLAGWQWRCYRWMFGAEASVDFSSGFQRVHNFSYTDTLSVPGIGTILYDRGDIYSLTGRMGYFVTPFFMPYIRLGGQLSRDEVSYQTFFTSELSPDFSSRTKNVYGYVFGAGAEFPTYIGSSTLRIEYNFVDTKSTAIDDNFFPVVGTHRFKSPESHVGRVSFVWNFL